MTGQRWIDTAIWAVMCAAWWVVIIAATKTENQGER